MAVQTRPIVADNISSRPVVSASTSVLLVAYAAPGLRPCGLGHMLLANIGDFLYWLYVGSLPFEPV